MGGGGGVHGGHGGPGGGGGVAPGGGVWGWGGLGAGRVLLMVFVALQLGSVDPLSKSSTTHSTA